MIKINEDNIQNECYVWYVNNFLSKDFLFYSVPNEIASNLASNMKSSEVARVISKFKAMGMRNGVADVHLCFPNGKLVYVEFKTPSGTQRKEQVLFQKQVELLGFEYHIIRSLEEFKELVCSHT